MRISELKKYVEQLMSGGGGAKPDYANAYNLTSGELTALATGDSRVPTTRPCMVIVELTLDNSTGSLTAKADIGVDAGGDGSNYVQIASPGAKGRATVTIPYLGPTDAWYAVLDGIGGASAVLSALEIPLI